VLDISAASLHTAQQRLGSQAQKVNWIEADITQAQLPHQFYDVWHDRAVFHFLTKAEDRQKYVEAVRYSVRQGGHVIVATFAPDGPERCSGLDVVRYSEDTLHNEFGDEFEVVDSTRETHHTPFGTDQKFVYCYCRKD
jgi:ubiquinone/menaquinone biosynthesis C-methylase UbiE